MMKNKKKMKNMEMRIYELLGIKIFRKMAFGLRYILLFPRTLKMSKEERKDFYNARSNYHLGKIKSLEDVKSYKKYLYCSATVHILALLFLIPSFFDMLSGVLVLSETHELLLAVILTLYCVMLQRYNCIRINQLIKRMTPRYEKQKNQIKDELRKNDALLLDHTYKIVDEKGMEIGVNFEDVIESANMEQLKLYREYLADFQTISNFQQIDRFIPMGGNKTLKLEVKKNR